MRENNAEKQWSLQLRTRTVRDAANFAVIPTSEPILQERQGLRLSEASRELNRTLGTMHFGGRAVTKVGSALRCLYLS